VSLLAALCPLKNIVELANAGTLAAFIAVSACVMALRVLEPARPRVFRAPLVWLVGPLAVVGCIYLFVSLPGKTQLYFLIWNAIGVAVYFLWGIHKSHLRNAPARAWGM
jgi:APA family basic amino acid/polyamine antiporter